MALPWADTTGFHIAPCLPCCTGSTPGECACALLIPQQTEIGGIYADYSTAASQIAAKVANCIGFGYSGSLAPLASFSADNTTPNQLVLDGLAPPTESESMYASLTVPASTVLTVAFTLNNAETTDSILIVTACDGTEAFFDMSSTSPFVTSSLPAGTYTVEVVALATGVALGADATFTITTSTSFVVNPVIALWDDSGTTRQLEACPKMYLPPLTESTGSWYASCADAETVMGDPLQVSNCVGYAQSPPTNAFTATDGGTSMTFTTAPTSIPAYTMWGSVNLEVGEDISFAYTIIGGVGGYGFGVNLYDYTGTQIDSGSVSASPSGTLTLLSGGTAPYTGRYFFRINGSMGSPAGTATFVITSSGVLSVNQIQARFDVGLTCPGLLDCGDSCPAGEGGEGGGGGDEL